MKRQKQFTLGLTLAVIVLVITATTVFAQSKNYYGLTTVYYNNEIVNGGSCCWNPRYNDWTNPSRSMDQFHVNVWTTYISCNYNIQYSTYIRYENLNHYNVTYQWDTMARTKTSCSSGTRRLHNYVQHWWQDSGQQGDGGTINQAVIQ